MRRAEAVGSASGVRRALAQVLPATRGPVVPQLDGPGGNAAVRPAAAERTGGRVARLAAELAARRTRDRAGRRRRGPCAAPRDPAHRQVAGPAHPGEALPPATAYHPRRTTLPSRRASTSCLAHPRTRIDPAPPRIVVDSHAPRLAPSQAARTGPGVRERSWKHGKGKTLRPVYLGSTHGGLAAETTSRIHFATA